MCGASGSQYSTRYSGTDQKTEHAETLIQDDYNTPVTVTNMLANAVFPRMRCQYKLEASILNQLCDELGMRM